MMEVGGSHQRFWTHLVAAALLWDVWTTEELDS